MSEAGLRLLDRDLPRLVVLSRAFLERQRKARKTAAESRGRDRMRTERAARAEQIRLSCQQDMALAGIAKAEAAQIVADAKAEAAQILIEAEKRASEVLARAGLYADRSAQDIINAVAEKHGVRVADIIGRSHRKDIVAVRHEAIARVYAALPKMSTPQIGRIFGNRDHTSIMHVANKMGVRRALDRQERQP